MHHVTVIPDDGIQRPLRAKLKKIAALARNLSASDDLEDHPPQSAARIWNAQLGDLVDGYLQAGRQDVLVEALDWLSTGRHDDPTDAWLKLQAYIHLYAGTLLDDVADPPETYRLCAIPVTLGPVVPTPDGDKLMQLDDLLAKSGLVHPEDQAAIVPATLIPVEVLVTLSYPEVSQLLHAMYTAKRTASRKPVIEFLEPRYDRLDGDGVLAGLYMILTLYRTRSVRSPFTFDSSVMAVPTYRESLGPEEITELAYDALHSTWQDSAEMLVADALGISSAMLTVSTPAAYFEAMQVMETDLRTRQFSRACSDLLSKEARRPEATIELTPGERSFMVTFHVDGKELGIIKYPYSASLRRSEGFRQVKETLESLKVAKITAL
ncbi:hypothetical protein P5X00_36470 [Paraburkholderia sp. A2RO-4L]|uniref:hypothetical protein n=1 Tax=Paraburkholderia sp. A2RO-4L TaxID=3028374 RepID=UPI0032F205CB|nr:hypothetical protein [Burkholderia vietnamiensis]